MYKINKTIFKQKTILKFNKKEVKLLQKLYDYMRLDKKANIINEKIRNIRNHSDGVFSAALTATCFIGNITKLSEKAEDVYTFAKENDKEIGLFNLIVNNMIKKELISHYTNYKRTYGSLSKALRDLIYSMDYEYFYCIKKDLNTIECLKIIRDNNTKVMIGDKQ